MFIMHGIREFVFGWSIMMGIMLIMWLIFNWNSGGNSQKGEGKNDLNSTKIVTIQEFHTHFLPINYLL